MAEINQIYGYDLRDTSALQEAIYDVTEIPYGSIEDVVYRLKAEPRRTVSATVYKRNTAANAEELAYAFTIEEDEYEGAEGYVARPKENIVVATSDGVIRAIWFGDIFDTFIDIGDESYTMTETSEELTLRINKYKFYLGNSTTQTAAELATEIDVDGKLSLTGGALTGDVTTPVTQFTDASLVTKSYVDAQIAAMGLTIINGQLCQTYTNEEE